MPSLRNSTPTSRSNCAARSPACSGPIPHSWIHIAVSDEDGNVTNWAVEFGAPYSLLQKGLRRTDFELGTEVVVNGFLAKSGEPVLNASNVTLPDGRDFLTAAEDSPGAGN